MSYVRRLVFCFAVLFYSASGFAIGLGELVSNSSLNEPFDARVEIINPGELDPDLIRVRLASAEDFERVGTPRELFLLDLDFSVDASNPQKPAIRITSTKPVREPYLDFLVEMRWPAGRILRGYTVFLDLPVFASKVSPQIAVSAPAPAARVAASSESIAPAPKANTVATGDGGESSGSYRVRSGDTLWSIAQRSRPRDSSIQQAMTAIYDRNSSAFIDGDMNRLQKGALLSFPDAHAIAAVDEQQARMQVARAVEDLQARTDVPQLVTSSEAETPAAATAPEADGVLRLLAPEAANATASGAGNSSDATGGEASLDREALENELAIAEEKLAKAEQENQILMEQLARQQEEVARGSRLLELEGSELAAIQQGIEPQAVEQDELETVATEPAAGLATEQAGLFDRIRDQLTLVAGGLLILILGILFLLARGRNKPAGTTLMADVQADLERDRQSKADSIAAAAALKAEAAFDEGLHAQSIAEVAEPEVDLGEVDPIGEADIYMSFGDYAQAEAVIMNGLESNPGDSRIHLKLLDILAAQDDADRFEEHYPKLLALGDMEAIQSADRMRDSLSGVDERVSGVADTGLDLDVDEDVIQEDEAGEALTASGGFGETELPGDVADQDASLDLVLDIPAEQTVDQLLESQDQDPDLALAVNEADLAAQAPDSEAPEFEAPGLEVEESLSEEVIDMGDLELDLEGEPAEAGKTDALDFDDFEDDLDSLVGGDEIATQLELAQAYVDMGDQGGATDILKEVIANGSEAQRSEAQAILAKIS